MKLCLNCSKTFGGGSWKCPSCSFAPMAKNGFLEFAPALSRNSGFKDSYFNQLAEVEPLNFWFQSRNRLLTWAVKKYFPEAHKMLEVGCGTGFVLAGMHFENPHLELLGSEISSEGLAFAKKRVDGAELFQMDARAIPFADELDIIGAFDVLEHIEDDQMVLTQFYRSLKIGGGILLTVPQHDFLWSQADEHACHVRRYSRNDLKKKVIAAGFVVERTTSFVSFLLPMMMVSRIFAKLKTNRYDSLDELSMSRWLNYLFERIMSIERQLLKTGTNLPAGGSLFLIARKLK